MINHWLHIPLKTEKTARHNRRAVWICLCVSLLFFFFLWTGLQMLWKNHALLSFIPEESKIVISLEISQKNWPSLLKDFGSIPLLKNQFLTLSDLAPFIKGNLALYVLDDGQRVVAFRSSKTIFPKDLFDSSGLVIQSLENSFFFVSTKPLKITNYSPKFFFSFKPTLGKILLLKDKEKPFLGTVQKKETGYRIDIPSLGTQPLKKMVWPDTFVAASSFSALDTQQKTQIFSSFFEKSFDMLKEDSLAPFFEDSGTVVFAEDNNNLQTLLSFSKKDKKDETFFLKLFGALQNPQIKTTALPDGSLQREIFINPEQISIEQMVLSGTPVSHVKTQNELFSTTKENELIFSTNKDLLSFWIKKDQEKNDLKQKNVCQKNQIGFIRLHKAKKYLLEGKKTKYPSLFLFLEPVFQEISLQKGKTKDALFLCY